MATTGRVLGGRYRLLDLLGTGASAQVFLADDDTLRRRVAVKVLHPALARDDAFLQRFRAEARAAAALSHPNLLAVYDWGEDHDGPYLVLEHLAGGSLRALLDAGHRLSISQVTLLGLEAARGLEAAHRAGFVHRDIKPANLLFGADGRLRIADFGVARALSDAGWTEHDGLVGTARYAAPEQGRTSKVDGRADVYALALVLVEAVTGSVPATGDDAITTLMARADRPAAVPDALGPLAPLLRRVLQPDPGARPDAAALVSALLEMAPSLPRPEPLPLTLPAPAFAAFPSTGYASPGVFDDATVSSAPVRPAGPRADDTGTLPALRRRRRRWPWVLLALLVVAGAVGGVLAVDRLRVTTQAVPDVTNLTEADARARITQQAAAKGPDFSWDVQRREAYDDAVPVGMVIRQAPGKDTKLADGKQIELTVSLGRVPVDLPDLTGVAIGDVAGALGAQGLVEGKVVARNDENVAKDHVITWSVAGKDRPDKAPKGTAVDVIVSAGPSPRQVPDVSGGSFADAKAALEAVQLVAQQTAVFSDLPVGEVVGTSPAAGHPAARGSTVVVQVSKGPDLVVVPDVSKYRTLDDAVAALEAAGLHLGRAVATNGTRPFASDPVAGTRVKRNSEVDVFLRR